jgi:anti-sigma B factor antagonist
MTQRNEDGILIMDLSGRLDSNTSPEFEEKLLGLIREPETDKVVLDFAGLDYISSAGLRVLLKASREIKDQEGKLVLCNLKDYIREVFEVSGFVSILPISDSVEGAKGEF